MRNTSELKKKNLLDIIKIIRNAGPLTKPEIAKLTNLTTVTAHNFICELQDKKLVVEVGSSESNGGRKAVLYKINKECAYIIAQNLGRNYISTAVFDILLNPLYKNRVNCLPDSGDRIVKLMMEEIQEAIVKLEYDKKDYLGVGITVPGEVNHECGVIINISGTHNWNSTPLKSIAENTTGIRTFVDNDINAIAIAAKWHNIVGERADAVFVSIGDGVGAGVLSKGKLYYGSHSYAGELGHTTIQHNGPKCSCGNRGCIEVMTADAAILTKVRKVGKNGAITIEDVSNLAKEGDKAVIKILKETGYYISIALDHIVKVYDPEFIMVQSNWLNEFPDLFLHIVEDVFNRCPWAKRDSLRIVVDNNEDIERNGPASLVLESMFIDNEGNDFYKWLTYK